MSQPEHQVSVCEQNKELVRAQFDKWTRGTGNFFEIVAPDVSWSIVGNSPISRTYSNTYAWFLQMRDRKVVKATAFFDTVILAQLWARVSPN